jgi:hypothetical protein
MKRTPGRKPLPLDKVRKVRAFTLATVDTAVIDYVNTTRQLDNESEALRLILGEYASLKGIRIATPTEAEQPITA